MGSHDEVFEREGEYWTIAFEGRTVRLRDSKGLQYIRALLDAHGRAVPAHVLSSAEVRDPEQARVNVTKSIRSAIRRIAGLHAELGEHFENGVRTGRHCAYLPVGVPRFTSHAQAKSSP